MITSPSTVAEWLRVIQAEYFDHPGLRLAKSQMKRLWGFDGVTCDAVLEALVDVKFLKRTHDGAYIRVDAEDPAADGPAPPRVTDESAPGLYALFSTDELGVLANRHPNVLLMGPAAATDHVLALTRPYLRPAVAVWAPREGRDLPNGACRTLVLRGLDAADARQQEHIDAWLEDRAGAVQVLATTATLLFPQVMRGAFREQLYYRVNQVYFDLSRDRPA